MRTQIYVTAIILGIVISFQASSQDFSTSINDAKSSYGSGNLDDARFAIEQALQQIDQAIGKEILKLLPSNLSGMNFHEDQDNVVGTNLGFAGLFVDRNYGEGEKTADIEIIGDSPLMGALTAIMALPAIMTSGDQKRIKVDGFKSIIEKETDANGSISYKVQIPANSTLILFNCSGYDENQVISMANQIPVGQIVKLAQ